MLSIDLERNWQPWSWMGKIWQMLRTCTFKIVPGNMMLCGSVLFADFIYLWTRFGSQENIWMAIICLHCFLYYVLFYCCNLAAVLQRVQSNVFVRFYTNILEELVSHTTWNHFPTDYNLKHLSVATSGTMIHLSDLLCETSIFSFLVSSLWIQ